jgi:hypothetical protein
MRALTPTGAIRAWWSLAMVLVTAVLIAAGSVGYTNHVHREGERRYAEQREREKRAQEEASQQTLAVVCEWMALRVNPEPPPTTVRGRQQLAADQKMYKQFGCDKR